MEEEIDLRPYIEDLLSNWYWIIGSGFITALIALGITFIIAPTYQATALIAIAVPRQRVQFDNRIETVTENQPLRAYPELALSDEVLTTLLSQGLLEGDMTLTSLHSSMEAELGGDPSLLRLVAHHQDAATAALVVNTWAELFVSWANRVYGFQGEDQLRSFQAQLEQAEKDLTASEKDLVAFQAQNRIAIVTNELSALESAQANYLNKKQNITILIQDITALRTQLGQQPNRNMTSFADQLTALFLEMKAFGIETNSLLQVQFGTPNTITQQSQQEQIKFLDDLIKTLSAQLTTIETEVDQLEPQILVLQEEQQNLTIADGRIKRNYSIVQDTYTALARQVEEEQIASQEVSSGVRLASRAAVPERPVSPRKLVNTGIAGIIGLLVAAFITLVHGWRRI